MLEADSDVYHLNEHIALRHCEAPSKFWAFNTKDGDHYSLNQTSYWVLSRFDGALSLGQILRDFLDTYDIDLDQGEQDISEIVTEFINEGLITRRQHESSNQTGLRETGIKEGS